MFGIGGTRLYSKRYNYESSLSSATAFQRPTSSGAAGSKQQQQQQRPLSKEEKKKKKEKVDEQEEGQNPLENDEIEIICNGIKYKTSISKEVALPELICEECEKVNSVLKCEDCNQVFCAYCFEICHVRPEMGAVLHPHELSRAVRPIRQGDTSKIVLDNSFKMPDYEYYEQEMVKHRNLTVPNSLAANGILSPLTNEPCLSLKYHRGDILVYIDPVTHQEVYGRVESEWDFRNGEVAPSLIRGGEGGLTHYIVRYLGPVTPLILNKLERDEDPTTGQSMNQSKNRESKEASRLAKLQSMPILEGVKSVQLRSERVLANKIDKRLLAANYLKTHGPTHHLNPPIPKGFSNDSPDDDDISLDIVDRKSDPALDSTQQQQKQQMNTSTRIGSVVAASNVKSTRPLTLLELRTQALPSVAAAKRTLEGVVAAYSLIAEVESTLYPNLPAYDIEKEPDILIRRQRILILPESALAKPSDRVRLQALRKRENIRIALTKRFALLFEDWLKYSFQLWVEWNREYTLRLKSIAAVKIQAQFRRWLCRDIVKDLQELSAEKLHKQWLAVHSKFNYCTADTPGAVTMDNKIYFASHRDVNRYSRQLRIAVSKFVNVANRQRLSCLFDSLLQWREVVKCSKEIDMKVTHCRPYQPIRDEKDERFSRLEHVEEVRQLHSKLRQHLDQILLTAPQDMARIDADPSDDSRFGILSFPMALERENHTKESSAPPPWHPSIGFHNPKSLAQHLSKELLEGESSSENISRAPSRAKSRVGVTSTVPSTLLSSAATAAPTTVSLPSCLPDLLPLPDLIIKNKQASLNPFIQHSLTDKQKYNSFKALISGPTDHSCWIIPGRLAMGRIPLGKARAKGPVDSIIHTYTDSLSQLLLVGLNSFVSLVEAHEENESLLLFPDQDIFDDQRSGVISISSTIMSPVSTASSTTRPTSNSLKDRVRRYHKEVKMELKNHLVALQDQLENKNIQLEEYANIEDPAPYMTAEKLTRIEQQKKEKLRLVAKKRLILDEMELTKKAMERFPSSSTWCSFPLKHNSVPPLDHIIPILWDLEQRLWQGECLYVYSKDGNGRAGLICACLLGRLYGLTPSETLLRMQTYFDCQRSQEKMTRQSVKDGNITMTIADSVSATCPHLSRQQELVSRILMTTNRVFQGISSRSQTNPESFSIELQQPKRGLRIVTAMEEKYKSKHATETKSSLELRRRSGDSSLSSTLRDSKEESVTTGDENSSPFQLEEMFTPPILSSIGRRSSTIARVLPSLVPTVCDSPVKLRVL